MAILALIIFARHGPRTIVIARFVPVLRTFAPFAAGFGRRQRAQFTRYNVLGALLGGLPVIRQNLSRTILVVVVISLLPLFLGRLLRKPVPATETATRPTP